MMQPKRGWAGKKRGGRLLSVAARLSAVQKGLPERVLALFEGELQGSAGEV